MPIQDCQNLVIGAGEAGKCMAWTLAKLGQKTIVIERSMIGGSCPNVACLPSKNIIFSAKVASLAARGPSFGVVAVPQKSDMVAVFRRKKEMIDALIQIHLDRFKDSDAELVMGTARFTEPKTVDVTLKQGGVRRLRGQRVFLAVGSRASHPDVPGLREVRPMTHVEVLNLQHLPEHVVILGGGYVGLEFAQAMRRFGSQVTLIHHGDRLLDREDVDVSEALLELMKSEGVRVLLKTNVLKVEGRSGGRVDVVLKSSDTASAVSASDILVAAGRTPNTDGLDLAKAGVELDARGHIRVNEKLETTAPGVWAMGDCAGSPHFTHVSFDDFRVVSDNLAGGNRTTRDRLIPYCLFTDPELAHVGMSESEARAKSVPYRLAKMPMAMVFRTRTLSETRGFVKALIGGDNRLLGFTAFGVEASEMMAAAQTAMIGRMPYTALRDAIFTHPTTAEGLGPLFSNVPPLSAPVSARAQ